MLKVGILRQTISFGSEYLTRTENIAGVKDMRFQATMPDVLHWLGITKIDRMISMSNMVLMDLKRNMMRLLDLEYKLWKE